MKTFWQKLPRPFFALAPMEDVTDAAFRRLIAKNGKPDVMYSEFTSADGLAYIYGQTKSVTSKEFRNHPLAKKLLFADIERPIVAQLFSAIPERMEIGARIVSELGFDGIDINMGCPDRAIEKSGCGAALMKNPILARELIKAARKGSSGRHLPVSVKTRIGYATDELDAWLPELLAEEPGAITIHARTRKEMSDVPARWDTVARAVRIRDQCQGDTLTRTLIIGNGDARDLREASEKAALSNCDGVMLGRAIYGNPWLFSNSPACAEASAGRQEFENRSDPEVQKKILRLLVEHLQLFDELLGGVVHFAVMKKHFKAYVSGFDGAKELRIALMVAENTQSAIHDIQDVINRL